MKHRTAYMIALVAALTTLAPVAGAAPASNPVLTSVRKADNDQPSSVRATGQIPAATIQTGGFMDWLMEWLEAHLG